MEYSNRMTEEHYISISTEKKVVIRKKPKFPPKCGECDEYCHECEDQFKCQMKGGKCCCCNAQCAECEDYCRNCCTSNIPFKCTMEGGKCCDRNDAAAGKFLKACVWQFRGYK